MKLPKGVDYFVMAFHPDDSNEEIALFDEGQEKFKENKDLIHEWLADLPACEENIRKLVSDYDSNPDESAEVVVYALIPVRRYSVSHENSFKIVLEKGGVQE